MSYVPLDGYYTICQVLISLLHTFSSSLIAKTVNRTPESLCLLHVPGAGYGAGQEGAKNHCRTYGLGFLVMPWAEAALGATNPHISM